MFHLHPIMICFSFCSASNTFGFIYLLFLILVSSSTTFHIPAQPGMLLPYSMSFHTCWRAKPADVGSGRADNSTHCCCWEGASLKSVTLFALLLSRRKDHCRDKHSVCFKTRRSSLWLGAWMSFIIFLLLHIQRRVGTEISICRIWRDRELSDSPLNIPEEVVLQRGSRFSSALGWSMRE